MSGTTIPVSGATTVNQNNSSANLTVSGATDNSTVTTNLNNSTGTDTATLGNGSDTVNLNNSTGSDVVTLGNSSGTGSDSDIVNLNNGTGNDTITTDNTGATTVNANNSTGTDKITIASLISAALAATVNLNNSTGNDDVEIAGMTVAATVNDNNSGVIGGNDTVNITGVTVAATVNLNNSLGNDNVTIAGTGSTNATVNLNNSGGSDHINIGSLGGATTATVNLNGSGGTDIVNVVGLTTAATVNLSNSTGQGDTVMLVGKGTGTINATNSTGNDTLIGANTTDTITGGSGNDTVDLKGAGTINAGAGNDLGIYALWDHYSIIGSALQSIRGDADYYNGQSGSNTLRIVMTGAQEAIVASQLTDYETWLPAHQGSNQIFYFNFATGQDTTTGLTAITQGGGPGSGGGLAVSGWQTLQIAVVTATITGPSIEGQTLTASVTATGGETGTASFQWQELVGTSWTNISGAANATYVLQEADENHQLRVQADFTDGIGDTIIVDSAPTAAVLDAAPTVTTPVITGTAQEGQTLTAAASSGQSDNPVSYQWQDNGSNIGGATTATYLVQESDEGHTIDVVATSTNDNGVSVSATSAATAAVLDAAPTVTTPVITGTAKEGQTLTASASSGQSDNPVSYQWQDNGSNIAGATTATYLVQESDEGHTIDVVATSTNDNGATVSATSAATAAVLDAAPTVTTPVITGTAQEGQTLTAAASSGQPDNAVTYQWQDNGSNIAGATTATYLVQESDEGHTIDVVATTTNDNGASVSATSAATAAVLDAAPTVTTPVITGTAQEGQTLTAAASSGQPDNPVSYQWQDNGSNIAGATTATYLVQESDEGHTIDVVATTTNDNGVSVSATSAATAAVLDAAPTVTTPVITGTAQEGQTLTAAASSGQPDNAVTYQWQDNGSNIAGATTATYLVQESDEGHTIDVVATTTNDNGASVSATSAATAAVLDAAPTVTTPVITGTAQEGQTLTAAATSGQSDNPVSYQWQDNGSNIAGATTATYLVQESDEGHTIDVVATTTNDNGVSVSATSAATAAVLDAAPTVTTPVITGTAQEGQTLTAAASSGQPDNAVTYQWQDNGSNVAGATGATYLVQESDEGHTIDVVATSTNDNGATVSATSAATAAVLDAAPTVTTPVITGTAQEGQTLTAAASSGQPDNAVTYQWQDNGSNIAGATGATYLVQESDEGHTIDVVATSTNDNGVSVSATSAATAAVLDAAPTVTTPVITGTAQEGQTLTAAASSGQPDNAVTYQWQDNGSNVAGATGATYLVQESDEGHTIDVVATTTNDNGVSVSATSAATAAVLDAAPTVTTPVITGTAQEGQTLTAAASSGQPDNAVTYQWQDNGSNIAGATTATYLVQESDEGHTIDVVATTTNDNGASVSATSAATAAVLDAAPTVTTPVITGTAQEGQTLTAAATSGQSDNPVSYQWQDNGSNIAGATTATYLVQESDEGHTIDVVATTTNDNGVSVSATSAATAAVLDAAPTVTTPVITGTAQEGQTLTAAASSGQPDNAVTYQWQDNGSNVAGATGATYLVQESDEGHTIDVVATSTNDNGATVSATSAATAAVLDAAPTVTTPVITGTAQEGQTLTAAASSGQPDNAVTYQWQDNGSNIAGATTATYLVQESDEGHTIDVVATTTNDNGVSVSATSAATAAVGDITLAFTSAASITGTAQEGQTLTAVNGALNDSDAAVTAYQWTRDGSNIAGATAATYTVTEADETHVLRVVETATDSDGGPSTTSTSAPTSAVTDITLAFTSAASITGTAQEGQTLSAVNGTLNDSDAAVTAYQWTRDGSNIAGSTAATYTVTEADETHVLRVVETATDSDGGPSTTSTSAPTSAVTEIALLPTITAGVHAVNGNNDHVTFVVTFPEAVGTVVAGDFTLFGTATGSSSPPTINSTISGSGSTYTVTVDYAENKNAGKSLGLNFVNTGNAVHDTESGETGNLAVATNITTAQFSSLAPAGVAGELINLALTNPSTDPGTPVALTITGVPSDWNLTGGTATGGGVWTATTTDPTVLAVTPPTTFAGATVLQVTESWTNADGSTGSASIADNVEAYASGSPIFAISGDDTLTGAGANDQFVFAQPIGNDTVHNFNAASDQIDLIGFASATSFASMEAGTADDANGNAVITVGAGESITLLGVSSATLTAGNFVFNQEPVTTNAATMTISDGAILPLGGTIDNTGTIALNSTGDETDLEVLIRGITLQGGGQVTLSDNSQNVIFGGDATAVFSNVDNTIAGAGQLGQGQLTLVNAGVIDASGSNALVIDTGSNSVSNSGTLESTGSGGLTVNSAVASSGLIWADDGNVIIAGAVGGGGRAAITGSARLEFMTASDAATSFAAGASGTLALDQSAGFGGTIAGFASGDAIDLVDLGFGAGSALSYTENAGGTGGTLAVTDGTHHASLAFIGQYTQLDFAMAGDVDGAMLIKHA